MSVSNRYIRKVAVIGGGAAGFFAAINIAEKNPHDQIFLFEKSGKVLQKVKVSGGGRCNVTNGCFHPKDLIKNYPRGGKELLPLFKRFQPKHTIDWFKERGVKIKIEEDQRAFPISNDSQTIIDCFVRSAEVAGVNLKLNHDVMYIEKLEGGWRLDFRNHQSLIFDIIVITTGGVPSMWGLLSKIGHNIISPVPSLFTFNIEDKRLKNLQGVAFNLVKSTLAGSKIESTGPMLITHWGLSGPAILKLSAFAARELYDMQYKFDLRVNFLPEFNFDTVKSALIHIKDSHPKKMVKSLSPFLIPLNYWKNLLTYCEFTEDLRWIDLGKKHINKLAEELTNATFKVKGKSTFKEEFVTCGGVDLSEVNLETMESQIHANLFFAGEVLDIDAITGGFNFQAAWTTAWVASETISNTKK